MKTYRADWVTDRTIDSLGAAIQIRSTDSALGDAIGVLTQHFPLIDNTPDHMFSVTHEGDAFWVSRNDDFIVEEENRDKALMGLLAGINQATIFAYPSLAVHAGVVSQGDRVIAFPASKHAGKSTLVAACLRESFDYLSDEALIIDTSLGKAVPYPKAIWLSQLSRTAVNLKTSRYSLELGDRYKSPVLPAELGGDVASGDLELHHVVLLERNGESPRLESVQASEIAFQLLSHTFNRHERPEKWFQAVTRLVRQSLGWRLVYRDALEAAKYLGSFLGKL